MNDDIVFQTQQIYLNKRLDNESQSSNGIQGSEEKDRYYRQKEWNQESPPEE